MTSPLLYIAGGVILIGGAWYAVSKWVDSGKCLTKVKLDAMVAEIKAGAISTKAAREAAAVLEKDGCPAADVKAIRDAATAAEPAACPPADYVSAMAGVATMTFEAVSSLAQKWEASGCATEAKALKDAFAAALKTKATPVFGELISKLPSPKLGGAPPPGAPKPTLDGWPAVNALPREYFDLVYPVVSQFNFAKLWEAPDADGIYPGKSLVCPSGGACRWSDLASASNAIRDTNLGPVPSSVRAAAVLELGSAAERVQGLAAGGGSGWTTTGYAIRVPNYVRRMAS